MICFLPGSEGSRGTSTESSRTSRSLSSDLGCLSITTKHHLNGHLSVKARYDMYPFPGQASRAYRDRSPCQSGSRTSSLSGRPLKEPPPLVGAQVVYPRNCQFKLFHFLPFRRYKDNHKTLLETSQVPKQASHPPASKVKV